EETQMRRGRQSPQDQNKGQQRHDRVEQVETNTEGALDEQLDVVGQALVGVVGGIALQLHALMIGIIQPFAEIAFRQPLPPPDLKPLIEVELVDGEYDEGGCKRAKDQGFLDEG